MSKNKINKSIITIIISLFCLVGCGRITESTSQKENSSTSEQISEETLLPIDKKLPLRAVDPEPVSPVSFYGTSLNIDKDHIWLAYYLKVSPTVDVTEPNYQNAFIKVYDSKTKYESTPNEPTYVLKFETEGTLMSNDVNSKTSIVVFYLKTLSYENLVDIFYAVPFYQYDSQEITINDNLEYGMIDYCINKEGDTSKYNDHSLITLGEFLKAVIDYATMCQKYFYYKLTTLANSYFKVRRKELLTQKINEINDYSSRAFIENVVKLYNNLENGDKLTLGNDLNEKIKKYKGFFNNVGTKENPYVYTLADKNFEYISILGESYITLDSFTANNININATCELNISNFDIDVLNINPSSNVSIKTTGDKQEITKLSVTSSNATINMYGNTDSETLDITDINVDNSSLEIQPDLRKSKKSRIVISNNIMCKESTFKVATNTPYCYYADIQTIELKGDKTNTLEFGSFGENTKRTIGKMNIANIATNNASGSVYINAKGDVSIAQVDIKNVNFDCDLESEAYKSLDDQQMYKGPNLEKLILSECEGTIDGKKANENQNPSDTSFDTLYNSGPKISVLSISDIKNKIIFNNIYVDYKVDINGDNTDALDEANIIFNNCYLNSSFESTITNCYVDLNFTKLTGTRYNFTSDILNIVGAKTINNNTALITNTASIGFYNTRATINGGIYSAPITTSDTSLVNVKENTYINDSGTDVSKWRHDDCRKIEYEDTSVTKCRFVADSMIEIATIDTMIEIINFTKPKVLTYSFVDSYNVYSFSEDSGKTYVSPENSKNILVGYATLIDDSFREYTISINYYSTSTIVIEFQFADFELKLTIELVKESETSTNLIACFSFAFK